MLALNLSNRRYGSSPYGRRRSRSLVKRRRRESPLIVDSHFSPSLHVSHSAARRQWPALLQEGRRTGNRRIDAMRMIGRSYVSQDDYNIVSQVVEWMKERMQHYPYRTRINPFTGQPDLDMFDELYQKAQDAYSIDNEHEFQQCLTISFHAFKVLSELIQPVDLQSGGLFRTILELAERFIPLFAELDHHCGTDSTIELIGFMDKITMNDPRTMDRLCNILSPQARNELYYAAELGWFQDRIFLCYDIMDCLR